LRRRVHVAAAVFFSLWKSIIFVFMKLQEGKEDEKYEKKNASSAVSVITSSLTLYSKASVTHKFIVEDNVEYVFVVFFDMIS
jgi:hypothetical protein